MSVSLYLKGARRSSRPDLTVGLETFYHHISLGSCPTEVCLTRHLSLEAVSRRSRNIWASSWKLKSTKAFGSPQRWVVNTSILLLRCLMTSQCARSAILAFCICCPTNLSRAEPHVR